jgi:competence protein ComEC
MFPNVSFISSIENTHELQLVHAAKRCEAGQTWTWDGVIFAVLHPKATDYDASKKSNAMSCVLRISTQQASVLLTGDIEMAQEARLVAEQINLNSSVLLVPHHGSKTSSSAAFLNAVQPKLAVVQAGYRNRFGHPAASVIERYNEQNIKLIDTAHCGALKWSSSAPNETRCQRDIAKRYWHHQVP